MARVSIDNPTLRNLVRETIRKKREPLFKALDLQFQLAIESGDDVARAAVVAKKQALRDAPVEADIEEINSIEDALYYVPPSFED